MLLSPITAGVAVSCHLGGTRQSVGRIVTRGLRSMPNVEACSTPAATSFRFGVELRTTRCSSLETTITITTYPLSRVTHNCARATKQRTRGFNPNATPFRGEWIYLYFPVEQLTLRLDSANKQRGPRKVVHTRHTVPGQKFRRRCVVSAEIV